MNDPLSIAAGEHGVTRVFALEMRPEQAAFQREPGAAEQMLGLEGLDHEQIDVIRLADLEDMGLAGYLLDGCGIPEDQIAPDRDRLRALTGWVMVVRSRAFGGHAGRIAPAPGVTLIAAYHDPGTDWSAEPLHARSAEPYSAPRISPRAARDRARRIGATLFGIVMALIALMMWLVIR
ncbi:hypothetical protein [Pseudodonghicola xiamenensis]|uniref:Uncharacterized protein n=1 Tax=Pseudodonghicola xiamenensis TaxID=337702 RepID=A0A8J3MBE6_9RHOB|nr:hypothetical protein [Pseudodonghicola xiamenensis]GHG84581.1 hypothetical protein GCM10010961_10880 [Pseudodonghicola xiamenensis]